MSIFGTKEQAGWLAGLSPTAAFLLGLVTSVLVLGTIGFFVLLAAVLTGAVGGQEKAAKPAAARAADTPSPARAAGGQVKPVSERDHIRGNPDAAVTLIEYSDYECPFCKSFHPTVQRLLNERQGEVRWVYRHFPLSFHQNAEQEAAAAECVAELAGNDAFWGFTDKIFERTTSNGTGFALADLPALAAEVGADRAAFAECLASGRYASYVQEDMQSGVAAGVDGTPGTILVDRQGQQQLIAGAVPYEQLKAAVEAAVR